MNVFVQLKRAYNNKCVLYTILTYMSSNDPTEIL